MKVALLRWEKNGKLMYIKQVQEMAKKNKISLTTPIKDLPQKSLNILLYGNEEGMRRTEIDFEEYAKYRSIMHRI